MIDNIIKSLIDKKSPSEDVQIAQWANESKENLRALQELNKIDHLSSKLSKIQLYDEDQAWKNIQNKAHIQPKTLKINTYKWYGVAALLILAIGTTWWFTHLKINQPTNNLVYTTTDKPENLTLPDRTSVALDSDSKLSINDDRTVHLTGQAYFNVTRQKDLKPFIVNVSGGKVVVLGTKFNVISINGVFDVAVTEGHVRVEYEGRSIDMYAKDRISLMGSEITLIKEDNSNVINWKKNILVFQDAPLDQVLRDVSAFYKTPIKLSKNLTGLDKCILTTKLESPDINEVIGELQAVFNAKIVKINKEYVITELKC